jgi:cytochrome c-type biogenesis protein CcmH/NrfG
MNKVLKIYSRIVLMIMPWFFLPFIYDGFNLGKSGFLLLTGTVGIVLWVVDLLTKRKAELKYSKWLGWLLVLLIWSGVSFWKMSVGGQVRSMVSGLGIGGLVGLVMWAFLWLQIRSEEENKKQFAYLSISGIVVGLISLIVFMIPASRLPFLWPKVNSLVSITEGWTATGSMIAEAVLFLFLSVVWIKKLLAKLKEKVEFGDYIVDAVAVAFFGLMTLLDVYRLVKIGWVYLDLNSAWVIAVENLKVNPIFGVGPGNFIEAFSRFRPASFNLSALWSTTFGVSSVGLLNLWTELGTVGLVIILLLVKGLWKKRNEGFFVEIVVLGLAFLLLPPTFLTWLLMVWVLSSFWGEVKTIKLILPVGEKNFNVMPYLVSLLLLVVVGFSGYKMTKFLMADYYWRVSLVATSKNDGSGAYNNQIKAIALNPNLADYRAVYAQTNLALAQNFLNVKEGEEISAENKEKASTLVQQAVREAQAAVNLDSRISAYWTNLGSIYASLVGVVDGTLDWSLQSFQQAGVIDPVNPSIYMQLGSMMYGTKDYASAERYFEEVVTNKNNYANAWYNWAYAAKQQNKLQDAVTRLNQAVALVPSDSEDYTKAKEELNSWQKELDAAVAKYNEQVKQQQTQTANTNKQTVTEPLTTPQPLPSMGKEEQVNVPAKDLEPPQATVTPSN